MPGCPDTSVLEKFDPQESRRPRLNAGEDLDRGTHRLEESRTGAPGILQDLDSVEGQLKKSLAATFNILEDFYGDRLHAEQIQKALINILEDLNESAAELRKAHDVLEIRVRERTAELARSNAELEQFAYVASHDLQEPLRMVSSYVQLLQRRYQGKLDADADEFIEYAAEGSLRMQRLLNDLLAYSRVGTRGKAFKDVSLEIVLSEVLDNLQLRIRESGAAVTHGPLPIVFGDPGQLVQLFQNLLENALKFRARDLPKIHITAGIDNRRCTCRVEDNGIGIAPEYSSRIFEIFQRLHTRKEYPGTGIGLAVCKRIVDRHGGTIWVESQPGAGATFCFTIPVTARSDSND